MRFAYLHGFASGVQSGKAQYFHQRFAELGIHLEVPDLVGDDFENLTISGQLSVVEDWLGGSDACLIGSSMGGYLAALCASRRPSVRSVVLLAPAFGFPTRWPEKLGAEKTLAWRETGYMEVFHYGENAQRRIRWQLMEDARNWPDEPSFSQPGLLFHGTRDDVVPPEFSQNYAANHPNVALRLLDSDHQLNDVVDIIWAETRQFLLG